jgi:hypothetical protein
MLVDDAPVTLQARSVLEPREIVEGVAVKEIRTGFGAGGGGGVVTVTFAEQVVVPPGPVKVPV